MKPFNCNCCVNRFIEAGFDRRPIGILASILAILLGTFGNTFSATDSHSPVTKTKLIRQSKACPKSITITISQDQKSVNDLFEDWKLEFLTSSDCMDETAFTVDGDIIDLESLAAPSACGGEVEVVLQGESDCEKETCKSYFKVENIEPQMVISLPITDFTCMNQGAPPTYDALPQKSISGLLSYAIYSACIDVQILELDIEEYPPAIIGNEYNFRREYTVTNDRGLSAQAVEVFTIHYDTTPPILIGVPKDITLPCGSELPSWPNVVANDLGNSVEVVTKETPQFTKCGGRYFIRSWNAQDYCGNTASQEQIIYFEDNTPPWINVPADITISCMDVLPPPTYEAGDDGCSTFEVEFSEEKNNVSTCEYDLIRTWKITDGCGMSTSKSQTIKVRNFTEIITPNKRRMLQSPQSPSTGFIEINQKGKKNSDQLSRFEIHPNPTTNLAQVCLNVPSDMMVNLELIGVNGKSFFSKKLNVNQGNYRESLDINHLKAGAYLVRVDMEGHVLSKRLIKSQ